jgi:hypothetical protein
LRVRLLSNARKPRAFAQDPTEVLNRFRGVIQQGINQIARSEWQRLPPPELACIDKELHQQGTSVEVIISRGMLPSDPLLAPLRPRCSGLAAQVPQQPSATGQLRIPTCEELLSLKNNMPPGSLEWLFGKGSFDGMTVEDLDQAIATVAQCAETVRTTPEKSHPSLNERKGPRLSFSV